MDYRCSGDFDSFNTIIYGHNMNNGNMFGELSNFKDEEFFDKNKFATIYSKDESYTLDFFAYMIVNADDKIIFDISADPVRFFNYVKKSALNYREPDRDKNVVALSTCSSQSTEKRIVLLANIIKK
ncbi:MAG: class B sortase [Oscillospiraceae bacterium]|nr:class B sortase [Oscillospiraceae bacterium]